MICSNLAYSQEICNNGVDDDGDGLIDLNDSECICEGVISPFDITSYIPNPSFENNQCCPTGYTYGSTPAFGCLDSWAMPTPATSDYYNICGAFNNAAGLQAATGNGFVAGFSNPDYKEYISVCTTQPLIAGTNYQLTFHIAMPPVDNHLSHCNSSNYQFSPLNISLFGSQTCDNNWLNGTPSLGLCPIFISNSWVQLGSSLYTPDSMWSSLTISFTPTTNINSIIIGPPCSLPPGYPTRADSTTVSCMPYIAYDDMILNTVDAFDPVTLASQGNACDNDLVLIANSSISGGQWQWYLNGIAIIGQTNSTIDISNLALGAGKYSVRYSIGSNCSIKDHLVNTAPTGEIIGSTIICQGDSIVNLVLKGENGIGPYTFTYSVNGGSPQTINSSVGDSIKIDISTNSTGNYTYNLISVEDSSNSQCLVNDSALIVINARPIVSAGVDQIVCKGDTVTLSATGDGTITWNDGVTNNTPFVINDTTTYTATSVNKFDCQSSDHVTISVATPPTINFSVNGDKGCSPLPVTFNNQTSGAVSYLWDFGDGTTSTLLNPTHIYNSTGCFNVSLFVIDENGVCKSQLTEDNLICIYPNPTADFTASTYTVTTSQNNVDFTNLTLGANSYLWDYGDGTELDTSFHGNHIFNADNNQNYYVTLTATNNYGCVDSTSAIINVLDEINFYIPNTFTPNGDEYNNIFKPIFVDGFDLNQYTMNIFNRWGEIIFTTHNVEVGWDGTNKLGNICQDGVYTWMIEIAKKETGEWMNKTGHVTLLK